MNYKDNKKMYYNDIFVIGQITPLLNQLENSSKYVPKEKEVKILRSRYNASTGAFFGLEYCIAFLTVRNDPQEQLFDYSYTKDNSKTLYGTHKMKIPNSFSTTVFSKHKVQDESEAFGTNFLDTFFIFTAQSQSNWKD